MPSSPQQQYEMFVSMLKDRRNLPKGELFNAVVEWLKLPIDLSQDKRNVIKNLVTTAFEVTETDLRQELLRASTQLQEIEQVKANANGNQIDQVSQAIIREKRLRDLLPTSGFFSDYVEYTENSEAPLAYHFFCALAGLVATVNRRIHFDMGSFRLYPPLGVLILGPSGIKKTSAADIIISILNEMQLTPVYAEKLTPEAMIESMKSGNATGIVYSPEMTVLLSRQKYMESIIPLLTRFMDSPDIWKSETIMRGKGVITNIAITCLMCSTLDWFIKNTPESIFGGGFIARNLLVLQEASSRVIALPIPSSSRLRQKIIIELASLHELEGEITLTKQANNAHIEWYENDKRNRLIEHEILETYYQRKPQHMLRLAIALHIAQHRSMIVCEECWTRALNILNWIERFLPLLAAKMFRSSYGDDQDLVIQKIRSNGGYISHSNLIRKMQYKMSSTNVKSIISSLKDAGFIVEIRTSIEHSYSLTKEEEDD